MINQPSAIKQLSLLFFFLILYTGASASIDQTNQNNEPTEPATEKKPPKVDQPKPPLPISHEIISVRNIRREAGKDTNMASIGETIEVRVSNGDSLKRKATCRDINGVSIPAPLCRERKVKLFINGRMILGIEPLDGAPQIDLATGDALYQFKLDRNTENDKIWADILGAPPLFNDKFFIIPVQISIGLEGDYALAASKTNTGKFFIERIHKAWFYACLVGVIILLGTLIMAAKNFGLLRDRKVDLRDAKIQNPNAANGKFPAPPPAPYSLGRFQMAFWFLLVITSYLFIWLITDAYDILTASVLGLIGIGAGTSLSAATIDNSKENALITETVELQLKQQDPAVLASPLMQQQLKDKIEGNLKQLQTEKSEGFFKDMLFDANGMSFHRLQMLTWTFVLGLLFIYNVWLRLSMPVFDATLLALQGLTAATYLGFKIPEKQN